VSWEVKDTIFSNQCRNPTSKRGVRKVELLYPLVLARAEVSWTVLYGAGFTEQSTLDNFFETLPAVELIIKTDMHMLRF
jgi:hypothetical protein